MSFIKHYVAPRTWLYSNLSPFCNYTSGSFSDHIVSPWTRNRNFQKHYFIYFLLSFHLLLFTLITPRFVGLNSISLQSTSLILSSSKISLFEHQAFELTSILLAVLGVNLSKIKLSENLNNFFLSLLILRSHISIAHIRHIRTTPAVSFPQYSHEVF